MPATVKQQGFSLPEVLLAMVLMVMVMTALGAYHRALAADFSVWRQQRMLWRHAWQQTLPEPPAMPSGWRVQRVQTSAQGCVSISATITSPLGRKGQMARVHCSTRQ